MVLGSKVAGGGAQGQRTRSDGLKENKPVKIAS
jgi:hypothetical protein